jgi:hypothetical protein
MLTAVGLKQMRRESRYLKLQRAIISVTVVEGCIYVSRQPVRPIEFHKQDKAGGLSTGPGKMNEHRVYHAISCA